MPPGSVILLAILWITWCTLHSLLISRRVHQATEKILGDRIAYYRLFYVAFSIITLVPVFWYQLSLPAEIIIPAGRLIRVGQAVLILYAIIMFYGGLKMYEMDYFLGLGQLRDFRRNREPGGMNFRTDGILAYVRHPWYSGGIAFLWGVGSITDVYLVSRTILTSYLLIGTLLEESKLRETLGARYEEYSRRVPMLIPWKIPFGQRPGK